MITILQNGTNISNNDDDNNNTGIMRITMCFTSNIPYSADLSLIGMNNKYGRVWP